MMSERIFSLSEIQNIYPFNTVRDDDLGFIISSSSIYQGPHPLIIPHALPIVDGHHQPFDYTAAWNDEILEALLQDLEIHAPQCIFASMCRFGEFLPAYLEDGSEKIDCFAIAPNPIQAKHIQIISMCDHSLMGGTRPLERLSIYYGGGYASYHNAIGHIEQTLCDLSIDCSFYYYDVSDEIIGSWIIPTTRQTLNIQSHCTALLKEALANLDKTQSPAPAPTPKPTPTPQSDSSKLIDFPSPF